MTPVARTVHDKLYTNTTHYTIQNYSYFISFDFVLQFSKDAQEIHFEGYKFINALLQINFLFSRFRYDKIYHGFTN